MSTNQFYITASWHNRIETLDECAENICLCLDEISRICPFCQDWYIIDQSRPGYGADNQILHNVSFVQMRHQMAAFLEAGVTRDDFDEPEPSGGYRLAAANDHDPAMKPRRVAMDFHGAFPPNTRGGYSWAGFRTDYKHEADPEIIAFPVFRAVLHAFARIWRPDYAYATCSDLREALPKANGPLNASWMTYLSAPLTRRVLPPQNVGVEWGRDGSVLLTAAEETFDVTNQDHMAAACAIRDALAPLNRNFPRL